MTFYWHLKFPEDDFRTVAYATLFSNVPRYTPRQHRATRPDFDAEALMTMATHLHDPRQTPDAAFITGVRARFPVEPAIDRVLTRKMEQRGGPPHRPVTLDELVECLNHLLADKLDKPFKVMEQRWMTGGSSKLQMAFALEWQGLDGTAPRHVTPMVLRMSPAESIVETSRRREFEMIRALAGLIPVPDCYWEDEDATVFPYPALVFAMVPGVAKPSTDTSGQVTGLGINYGPALRPAVTAAFMDGLAKLHTADVAALDLPSFELPPLGSNAGLLKQVAMWRTDMGRGSRGGRAADAACGQLAGRSCSCAGSRLYHSW